MVGKLYVFPKLTSIVVFLFVLGVGEYVVQLEVQREQEILRSQATVRASTVRASVEAELNSTIFLGIGLSGYFSLAPELDGTAVMKMLESVYRHGQDIRNIGIAPDNRIAYVFPLEGNEAAIGLDYRSIPEQWPGVQRAIEEQTTVVVGPIKLIQGGYGIITRTPVFQLDGSYWGIVSVVIDVTGLLERVSQSHSALGIPWALRAESTGADPFVFGDASLFDEENINQEVVLPGGTWEMAVAPSLRARESLARRVFSRQLLNIPVAVLMGLLVYMVLRERTKVHHMAVHDTLTGLPNRRLLFERLEQRIALAVRYSNAFCIVFVDLNKFKPINDTYGHRCGDVVLCEVAKRMRGVVRGSDTVARVGGDEFVILLPDTSEIPGAEAVCRNLLRAIEVPVATDKGELRVSASVGVGRYPDHGKTPGELIGHADSVMYAEKERNRDGAAELPDA